MTNRSILIGAVLHSIYKTSPAPTDKLLCSAFCWMAKLTGEDFGPRDIPVYETIRSILRDYPDGQIFKVLNSICHLTLILKKKLLAKLI